MWPFNLGEQMPPRRWADMSFEFKGMFFYHGAIMVLFALPLFVAPLGRQLPDHATYIFVASAIALSVAIVSAVRRARLGWHWRGAGIREGLSASILVLLMAFFASSVTGKFPPPNQLMPWYLGIAGFALFFVLQTLRIVHFAEADFRSECGDAALAPRPEPPREAKWKRVVRTVFSVFFLAVWLEGVGFFYFHSRALENSLSEPAGTQTWSIEEKGRHHYVSKEVYDRDELLKAVFFIGVPSAIAMAALLQYVLGIKMGWPTREEKDA